MVPNVKYVKNDIRALKKLVPFAVAFLLITTILTIIPSVSADDPAVGYASPADDSTFVDVVPGDGVNVTVNVTHATTNLAWVKLYANDSGSWVLFYDSGALGGVAYHNVTVQNENWTGSWEKYYYNISANDGATHDTTYSFTTEYVFGGKSMIFGDFRPAPTTMGQSVFYKNNTGDYYIWGQNGSIDVKTSSQGWDWMTKPKVDVASGSYPYNAFTYNNIPYVYYHNSNLYYAGWDGSSWVTGNTGIVQQMSGTDRRYYGADVKYYDGEWCLLAAYFYHPLNHIHDRRLSFYTSTNPLSSFALQTTIASHDGWDTCYFMPSLAVFDGKLVLTSIYGANDLHWNTYNGATWTDKGSIEGATWQSMVKDPVNDQLVLVYIDGAGSMYYRTLTSTDGTWSDAQLISIPNSGSIQYPHVSYIDRRLAITFSGDIRGTYSSYLISAPDYSQSISGLEIQFNRIQWADVVPTATNVVSTPISLKNVNDRDIKNITWHFEDIGEITAASNIKVWTNMSGSWATIGTCDASGNVTELDISGEMAGGGEWISGVKTYWKFEILAVGAVNEDMHTTDEDVYYIVDF